MKKRYKVRFYKAHDLDLITYMASHSINLKVTLYYVLRAYCNGTVIGIRIPEQIGPRPSEYNMIYCTYLYLDPEKDKKMIEFIEGIKPGFRNNFMKNLLRQYLCTPLVRDFLVSPTDYGKVEQTTRMLQGGRKMVDIDYEAYKEAQKGTVKRTKASRKDGGKLENSKESNLLDDVLASLAESQGVSKKDIETKLAFLLGNSADISGNEQTKTTSSEQDQQEMANGSVTQPTANIEECDMGAHPYEPAEDGSNAPRAGDEEPEEDDDLTDAFSQILSI